MSGHVPTLEELYYEAYALVDQGICYDEVGQRDGALAMYEKGLQLIDQAGQRDGASDSPMYQKMIAAREHILYRLKGLRIGTEHRDQVPAGIAAAAAVPTPIEAIENTIEAFGDAKSADELFFIQGGVQIFFIRGEETSVPSYPGSLRVFKFKPDSPGETPAASAASASANSSPPAFLQVGDWIYPLVPGRSPVLHSTFGAYIFPNPTSDAPDLYVGVILPHDLDQATVDQFEKLMKEYTEMQTQTTAPPLTSEEKDRLSKKIAKLLLSGGEYVAWGINVGAEKTVNYIQARGEKHRSTIKRPDQPMTIDPRVQTSVHYLRRGTKVAVKVSGYLVDKLGDMAIRLGKRMASSTESAVGKKSMLGGMIHGALEIVGGGVAGAGTVWMGMEGAAKTLAKSIANESVLVVDTKYGPDAANLTKATAIAAGQATMAAWNIQSLGPKSIAKRTAKTAGLALLKDLTQKDKAKALGDGSASGSDSESSPKAKKKS